MLAVALYLIAVTMRPPALKQWLGFLGLVLIAAVVVPLLRIGGVLPSRYGAVAAAGGALVAGLASVTDIRQNLLSGGEKPWQGALVFAIALVLFLYLIRGMITDRLEHFCRSRLYHRIVDQDALNDLLSELDDDTGNDDAE